MNKIEATVIPHIVTLPPVPPASTVYTIRFMEWSRVGWADHKYEWVTRIHHSSFRTPQEAQEEANKIARAPDKASVCIVTIPALEQA